MISSSHNAGPLPRPRTARHFWSKIDSKKQETAQIREVSKKDGKFHPKDHAEVGLPFKVWHHELPHVDER